MELSHAEVRRIAELAKLDLTDEEVALYGGKQLIMDDLINKLFVSTLSQVVWKEFEKPNRGDKT